MTELFYDSESDVLYLSAGEPRPAISREMGEDVLARVDAETGAIVGLTVLNLSGRFGAVGDPQTLPIEIAFHPTGQG